MQFHKFYIQLLELSHTHTHTHTGKRSEPLSLQRYTERTTLPTKLRRNFIRLYTHMYRYLLTLRCVEKKEKEI